MALVANNLNRMERNYMTMKAIVYNQYGPPEVLQTTDWPMPSPSDDEVLVKVRAATVTSGDCNARGFVFVPRGLGPLSRLIFGLRKPRKPILGTEVAGDVVAIGKRVTTFRVGDPIFGIASDRLGAYAQYACYSADGALAPKPTTMSYEEAAALPFGATTALYFLRNLGGIQRGQSVLVNGASGGVGNYAVQLAKYFGANVTGVCRTANMALVRSLGADEVLDYTRQDVTTRGRTYDLIVDTVVGKTAFARYKSALKPHGRYLAVAGGLREMGQALWTSFRGGKRVMAGGAPERKEDLFFLKELAEAEALKVVIDRCYPLEDAVAAHRYVDSGRKKGNVVLTVAHEGA